MVRLPETDPVAGSGLLFAGGSLDSTSSSSSKASWADDAGSEIDCGEPEEDDVGGAEHDSGALGSMLTKESEPEVQLSRQSSSLPLRTD